MQRRFNRPPLLTGNDVDLKRQEIRDYFHATHDRYEQLFEVLTSDEAYYAAEIPAFQASRHLVSSREFLEFVETSAYADERLLGKHFRLIEGPLEVPFVIRETRRKFEYTLSEATIWERLA